MLQLEQWLEILSFSGALMHSNLQVQAVRYIIFTVSMRAKQMITRFTQMHADKTAVGIAFRMHNAIEIILILQAMHAFNSELARGQYGNILLDLQGNGHGTYSNIFEESDQPMSVYLS